MGVLLQTTGITDPKNKQDLSQYRRSQQPREIIQKEEANHWLFLEILQLVQDQPSHFQRPHGVGKRACQFNSLR